MILEPFQDTTPMFYFYKYRQYGHSRDVYGSLKDQ